MNFEDMDPCCREELISAAIDEALKTLLDRDLISFSWCDEKEEFVFFLSDEQKEKYDQGLGWEDYK